ncbi:MAG: hypothetical protein WA634_16080, partial [Silvibacterium sp.]
YGAMEPGHSLRTWLQDLNGGRPRAISPENVVGNQVSPDGKWLLAESISDPTQRLTLLVPIDGGAPIPIAGLKPDDNPMAWTSDNRLYIAHDRKPGAATVSIEKLDPRTGARTPWRDIPVLPLAGIRSLHVTLITPDGSSYAYGYVLGLSDLYTITGAR